MGKEERGTVRQEGGGRSGAPREERLQLRLVLQSLVARCCGSKTMAWLQGRSKSCCPQLQLLTPSPAGPPLPAIITCL